MRRPAAFITALLAGLLLQHAARATDLKACLGAAERGQRARAIGKLRQAREEFLACGSESCPGLVRRDCTQWQVEIVALLPNLVLGAKDSTGRDLVDVSVSVDGEALVKSLDGKSVTVDPGPHTFKFETAGAKAVSSTAVIREGEKTRVIAVVFDDMAGPAAGSASPTAAGGGHTIYPWLVVGAGVAAVGVGAVLIATAPSLPPNCDSSSVTCSKLVGESDADLATDKDRARSHDVRPIEGLTVGAIGLAVVVGGLLWHFLEPTSTHGRATTILSPWIAGTRGRASFLTSF